MMVLQQVKPVERVTGSIAVSDETVAYIRQYEAAHIKEISAHEGKGI